MCIPITFQVQMIPEIPNLQKRSTFTGLRVLPSHSGGLWYHLPLVPSVRERLFRFHRGAAFNDKTRGLNSRRHFCYQFSIYQSSTSTIATLQFQPIIMAFQWNHCCFLYISALTATSVPSVMSPKWLPCLRLWRHRHVSQRCLPVNITEKPFNDILNESGANTTLPWNIFP